MIHRLFCHCFYWLKTDRILDVVFKTIQFFFPSLFAKFHFQISYWRESLKQVPRYNNINNQVDVTITFFINNPNQLNMFRAMISPIFRSTRLCLQIVVKCTGGAAGLDKVTCWQHRRYILPQAANTV